MFSGGPGILSSSFFIFLIGDVLQQQQPRNDKEGGGGCRVIQMRGLVSLSVCLQLHAHYCPCCLCLSLPGPRLIPGLPFDRADSRQGKNRSVFMFILGWEGAGKLMAFNNEYSILSPLL